MRYERGRDAQDGGANMKREPRETGGVIYRHTHIHTGSTPAAVPPGHHTHGHIHPLPSPPLPSQAGGAGQRPWQWGSCDCLVRAKGPVRAKGAGQNQARKVPPHVGILRDLLARPSSGTSSERPLPRQPARKGSLWAAALPTASQEAGEWGPAQQCRPVATLGGSSSWSRARALSILRGHTWLSTSLLRENGPRARRGQRRRRAGRAAPSERADRGGAGGRLSPRGGACAPRGRGRGSPGGSPR